MPPFSAWCITVTTAHALKHIADTHAWQVDQCASFFAIIMVYCICWTCIRACTMEGIAVAMTPITSCNEGNPFTSLTIRSARSDRSAANPTAALIPCDINASSTVPVKTLEENKLLIIKRKLVIGFNYNAYTKDEELNLASVRTARCCKQ